MKNILKTGLLMTTMLMSGFLFGQSAQKKEKDNNRKFKLTAGLLNVRGSDDLDDGHLENGLERGFLKTTYQFNDHWSVSSELSHVYFAMPDQDIWTLSPSIAYKNKNWDVSIGFFPVNNEPFAKLGYQFNDQRNSVFIQGQNITRKPFEASFLPEIPENLDAVFLAMAENKSIIYADQSIKIQTILGVGGSLNQAGKTNLALKTLFLINYGDLTLGVGVQPLSPLQFDERGTIFLKYAL